MKKINVLIFPCGAENAIEIHTALKDCVNINVFGASSSDDHGAFIYEKYINGIPFIQDFDFFDRFNEVIAANKIDIIFPTHDTVSFFFAENLHQIKAKIAVPGLYQARICRFKTETYNLFADTEFCPIIYKTKEEINHFPVFIKPNVGEGGKNTKIIKDEADLLISSSQANDFIVVEYLPGDELTVDCFSDRHGIVRFIGPRKRHRTFSGISVNSYTVPLSAEIKEIAEVINERLKLRGLWFFQIKQDGSNKYKLMEISVRCAGTMNLYRNLGVNFPLLTIYDLLDQEVKIIYNNYYLEVDRALFNRYKSSLKYETIYIDFDDTITKNKKANPFIMMFLFNQKNKGKTIKVITRHGKEFDNTLHLLGIHNSLFDEVIHLTWEEKKYNLIKDTENSIFIDNSFAERLEVKENLKMPVFDVDAIQSLIDWRE